MSNRRRLRTERPAGRRGGAGTGRGQRIKLAAAVGVPLALAVTLIALVSAGDSNGDGASATTTTSSTAPPPASPEGQAFLTRIDDALRTFADQVPPLIRAATEWNEGTGTAENLARQANLYLPEAVKGRDAVAAIPPLDEAPAARDLFRDSVAVYVEIGRVYLVATDPAAQPLAEEFDLMARRLRVLADRTYDQARTMVDPAGDYVDDAALEIRRAPEVPDWVAEGLAPGPPLAGEPPPPAEVPPERERTRPEEPEEDWLDRVEKADFPTGAEVAAAIRSGDEARLGRLADSITAKVTALRLAPDPEGGRVRSAVAALSYLVQGEAARVAQLAAHLPEGEARQRLGTVARRLVLIGESLLEEDLQGRPSGFDPSLLTGPDGSAN